MTFHESLIFYLVFGAAVATAFAVQERAAAGQGSRWAIAAACLFWPLFLPLVLARRGAVAQASSAAIPRDDLTSAVEQVERELESALSGFDDDRAGIFRRDTRRFVELRAALLAQADRIRAMEALLERERVVVDPPEPAPGGADDSETDARRRRSRQARRDNMERLAAHCRRARCDMSATFAWIRELVSMIHLAKFTGAPAARAEELVGQIAAAVESLTNGAANDASDVVETEPVAH